MIIRLDKYLADMGIGTRSEVKADIKKGKININGIVVKDANLKIDTDKDKVLYQGNPIVYEEFEYYMLNKPAGVVSATTDKNDKTVVDLITSKKKKDLFPVGRLDKDTEGLLIICNDGELCHNLLSPKKHIDKTYYVCLNDTLSKEAEDRVCKGVYIEKDVMSMPATLERITDDKVYLTIQEGKFHQVKKMFHGVGLEVTYLKRVSMGGLKLDERLKEGEFRPLTKEEIEYLKGVNHD
ncbi:MAG: rRNA pseudouridine synthase [Lachnospiraceae bacterium]|nr:rRNA pseudouridine synthase [Lachnospiraceae bacterium]